MKYINREIEEK